MAELDFRAALRGALNLSLLLDPTRWSIVLRLVIEQFGWSGAALSVFGLIVLFKRMWRVALILVVTFVGYFCYGLIYNVPDVAVGWPRTYLYPTKWKVRG